MEGLFFYQLASKFGDQLLFGKFKEGMDVVTGLELFLLCVSMFIFEFVLLVVWVTWIIGIIRYNLYNMQV